MSFMNEKHLLILLYNPGVYGLKYKKALNLRYQSRVKDRKRGNKQYKTKSLCPSVGFLRFAVLCKDLPTHIEREDTLTLVSLSCPLSSFSAFFSISRKQASQYTTLLPAFQPGFSSPSSKTEHLMQKTLAQLKQIYFVGAKQEPHTGILNSRHYLPPKIPFCLLCACYAAQNCGVMGKI